MQKKEGVVTDTVDTSQYIFSQLCFTQPNHDMTVINIILISNKIQIRNVLDTKC